MQFVGKYACSKFDLHLAGCMLYWAEGAKSKNSVAFVNTDVYMMQLFMRFLRECYEVPDNKIAVRCRSHVGNKTPLQEVEKYWLETLCLPESSLRKGSLEERIATRKTNRYEYGMCTVQIYDTSLCQRIFGAIKHYVGIEDDSLWVS